MPTFEDIICAIKEQIARDKVRQAAPDLLAALHYVHDVFQIPEVRQVMQQHNVLPIIGIVDAAIRKAKGEEE
jgi:hypothetical protein